MIFGFNFLFLDLSVQCSADDKKQKENWAANYDK